MLNPYREAAPWARAITLVILGAVVLYGLGRWNASVDHKLRELKAETAQVIDVIQGRRAWTDSVKALEDSLAVADSTIEVQTRRTRAVLRELAAQDSAVVARVESTAVDDLLPQLRMHAVLINDTTWFATDSAQVRVLARGMLRLPLLLATNDTLHALADSQETRISILSAGWAASRARADSLQIDVNLAVPVLEAWQKYSSCKILGMIKCPSRTTSFIIGVLAGGAAVYIGSKE